MKSKAASQWIKKMNKPYRILFKFPSRGRVDRFFTSLESIYNNLQDYNNFHVAVTLDSDDLEMATPEVISRIRTRPNISIQWGLSDSKVHAINRDMPDYEWDILILVSDDITFTFYGFDQIIRNEFDTLDMLLHAPDNDEKDKIAVLYIAGRSFYNRFGFIYNPVYQSLFCDTELTEISRELDIYKYINCPGLFFHALPAYGHLPADEMWEAQQKTGWTIDQQTYLERKAIRLKNPDILKDWFEAYKNNSI